MRLATSTFLLLTFFSSLSFAQGTTDRALLEWNEFYTLSWEDFEGAPAPGAFGDAATAIQIKAKPYKVGKKVKYDVYAYFDRRKSWTREKSGALLAHEQFHFHIAELYARKIRKRIAALEAQGINDVDVYNRSIKALLQESNEADAQYDRETLHGAMQNRQASWEKKVTEELAALDDFRKKKQVIGVKKLKKGVHIF